jgi:hypothetical protein
MRKVFVLHFQRTLTICKAGALLNGHHELSVGGVVLFSMQIVGITKDLFIFGNEFILGFSNLTY